MSGNGNRADISGYERRKAKKARRRPQHVDKYAPKPAQPADRELVEKLDVLARHFNGEEVLRG